MDEDVQVCLNCQKPKCTNCLGAVPRGTGHRSKYKYDDALARRVGEAYYHGAKPADLAVSYGCSRGAVYSMINRYRCMTFDGGK